MKRYALVTVGTEPAPRKWSYLLRDVRLGTSDVAEVRLEGGETRAVATAKVLGTGAASVLLLGGETIGVWRPDLKVGQVQGVPMMLGWEYESKAVAVCSLGWTPAFRAKHLESQMREAVAQWAWRGRMGRFGRWPETCVKCDRELRHYDVTGIAWCGGCFPGPEPPVHSVQLSMSA